VPWELLLLAGAAGTYAVLRGSNAVTVVQNVAQVNLLVVLFPLLFILGGSVLAVRLLTLLLPLLSARATRLPAAWYLAARRLSAARLAAVVLLAAAAAPVAIAVYAAGLTSRHRAHAGREGQGLHRRGDLGRDDRPADPLARTDQLGTIVRRYSYGMVGDTQVALHRGRPGHAAGHRVLAERVRRPVAARPAHRAGRAGTGGRLPAIVVDPGHELGRTADVTLGTSTAHVADRDDRRAVPGPPAAAADDHRRPEPARPDRPARRLVRRAVDQRPGRAGRGRGAGPGPAAVRHDRPGAGLRRGRLPRHHLDLRLPDRAGRAGRPGLGRCPCCCTSRPASAPGWPRTRWGGGWGCPGPPTCARCWPELGLLLGLAYAVGWR
jgi:hypothetical protein